MELSLEELMNIEVTSVTKSAKPLKDIPAAVFVITKEDIRRSSATTVADLFRFVPGMQVGKSNASSWAVGARGFNSTSFNKMLVLIDGRSTYTPLHAATYWDTLPVALDNIERIEIIRGPGATLWGSNAVNGVVNIVTIDAKDTQGNHITALAGDEERGAGLYRYGSKVGDNFYHRVTAQYFDRDNSFNDHGNPANDSWYQGRGSYHADWGVEDNKNILRANFYNGERDVRSAETLLAAPFTHSFVEDNLTYGGDVLYRKEFSDRPESHSHVQIYADESVRDSTILKEIRHTLDLEYQKGFPMGERNQFIWGTSYRLMEDDTRGSLTAFFDPENEIDQLFGIFFQDEYELIAEALTLTVGSKLEYNDYTDYELQPRAALSWMIDEKQTLWTSVSRAVRIPTRLDHHLDLNVWLVPGVALARVPGDQSRVSEELLSYEIGYRNQPFEKVSYDIAAFFNKYDNLTTLRAGPADTLNGFPVSQFFIDDQMKAETAGVELAANYEVLPTWNLKAAWTYLNIVAWARHDAFGTSDDVKSQSPQNQLTVRSMVDLPFNVEFDTQLRYVGQLRAYGVKPYTEMDTRLAWHPKKGLEIALVGQNLLRPHHYEFGSVTSATAVQVERSVYGKITLEF